MKTENVTLTKVIEKCFDFSMDGRVPSKKRKEFLALGKQLRGALLNLLTMHFEEGTAEVVEANKKIKSTNNRLRKDEKVLDDVAKTLEKINELATALDGLLKFAASAI